MMNQSKTIRSDCTDDEIPRLKKEDMKDITLEDDEVMKYHRPKNAFMPAENAKENALPPDVQLKGTNSARIAHEKDFEFFKSLILIYCLYNGLCESFGPYGG